MRFKPGLFVLLQFRRRNCWSSEALRATASGCYWKFYCMLPPKILDEKVVDVRSFVLLANRDEGGVALPEIHLVGSGQ